MLHLPFSYTTVTTQKMPESVVIVGHVQYVCIISITCFNDSISYPHAHTFNILVTSCPSTNIRLVGGGDINEGRVEICIHGAWGTVCNDLWGVQDAMVVCNQLGYLPEGVRTRMPGIFSSIINSFSVLFRSSCIAKCTSYFWSRKWAYFSGQC